MTFTKKFSLLALLAFTGISFAQTSADGTAEVNAKIVQPISITSTGSLDFGTFTTPETGSATVLLNPADDTRDFSSTDMELASFGVFELPEFTVTKEADATYAVLLAVTTAPIESGGTSMTLDNLTTNIDETGNTASSFKVGGTLNVPSTQNAGVYTGMVNVTVTYE